MELQFQKDTLNCLTSALREVKQAELTQEIRLPDGMPDIGRMIGAWGQVLIRGKEWRSHDIGVSGGLMICLVYVPEDGTEPRNLENWIPFQMMWDLKDSVPEGTIRCLPFVRFVDARSTSARKIMVRAGIVVDAQALYPMESAIYSPGELPEDVELLRRTYPVVLPLEAGERVFATDEDLSFPEGLPMPEKILGYSVQPEILDKKVMGNKLVFKGNGNLHLLYRCTEGKLHSTDFPMPFSQYADLQNGYGNEASGDLQLALSNLEADMPQPGQLRVKCGMIGQYLITDQKKLELTEDAYSPRRNVTLLKEELKLPVILDSRTEILHADQGIPGFSGEMVDLRMYPDAPGQRPAEDGIQAEVPVLFQGIAYGQDGTLQSVNARTEAGLRIPADGSVRLDLTVQTKGNPQALAAVDGTGVSGQMALQIAATGTQGLPMVTGMNLEEEKELDAARPSLIICRSGGETLWDLAKRCNSTVRAISDANGLQEEPASDRLILIPVC